MSLNLRECDYIVHDCYLAPSVEGAIAYLSAHRGEALLLAGGTDLGADIEAGELADTCLVDVSQVGTMRRITREDGYLICGGAVTFAVLAEDEVIRQFAPLLRQAGAEMGNADVRQLATLGGQIASARGNADGAVALVALRAEAEIANLTGTQWLPVESLYVRNGVSRVDSTSEIITATRFHGLRAGQGMDLQRLVHPGLDPRPLLVLALVVTLAEDDQTIEWASVAVGSAVTIPAHLPEVEEALGGLAADTEDARRTFVELVYERIVDGQMLSAVPCSLSEDVVRVLPKRAFGRAVRMAHRKGQPALL